MLDATFILIYSGPYLIFMAVLARQFRYLATFSPQSRNVYEQPGFCVEITSVYSVVIIRR